MTIAPSLPLVLPLAGAAISMALGRWHRARRVLGVSVLVGVVISSIELVRQVSDGSVLAVTLGVAAAPIGITLVVDTFSAFMLGVSSLMLLAVLLYAIGSPRTDDTHSFFHPVYLILATGVSASFLTGDLFNLFVAFEVTLTASYVLITFGGSRLQVRHGMSYIVINLLASTLFITAVGLVYASTGTVNMANLATRLTEIDPGLRSGLGVLLLIVFGIKAAIFPLFFWLPDAYPAAAAPVTAIFAGLLTKVGVYSIIRTQTLLFGDGRPSTLLLWVAGLTMVVGILGAMAQDDIKRILSFHIVSQIGYMIFGLALFTAAGLAAAVLFVVHQILIKTTLFLVGGLVEERTGTAALRKLGGLIHASPLLAALFLLPALSLAGIPPSSGFVAKLALVQAGLAIGQNAIVAVSLAVSILTLFSMIKIWAGAFWGEPNEPPPIPEGLAGGGRIGPPLMVIPTAGLVLIGLAFVAVAGPLYGLAETAAAHLVDPTGYISAVMGP